MIGNCQRQGGSEGGREGGRFPLFLPSFPAAKRRQGQPAGNNGKLIWKESAALNCREREREGERERGREGGMGQREPRKTPPQSSSAEMNPPPFLPLSLSCAKTKLKADNRRPIVKIPQEPKIHDSNCHFGWKNKSNKGGEEEDQYEFQSHSMVGFPRDERDESLSLSLSLSLSRSLICSSSSFTSSPPIENWLLKAKPHHTASQQLPSLPRNSRACEDGGTKTFTAYGGPNEASRSGMHLWRRRRRQRQRATDALKADFTTFLRVHFVCRNDDPRLRRRRRRRRRQSFRRGIRVGNGRNARLNAENCLRSLRSVMRLRQSFPLYSHKGPPACFYDQ